MVDLRTLLGEKQYKEALGGLYREVALSVTAQVQLVKDRNKRIMGARRALSGSQLQRYLDRADAVRRKCATIRQIHYRPILASALRLVAHYQKEDNQEKVDKIKLGLAKIRIVYNTYFIIEEAANECFDEIYNQTEVLAVQGLGRGEEEEDQGPRRVAIEDSAVQRNNRRRHAQKDDASRLAGEEEEFDPFDAALDEAAADAFGPDVTIRQEDEDDSKDEEEEEAK